MKIVVFGLGRIGLSPSFVAAESGCNVIGVDIDTEVIESLREGEEYFQEPKLEQLIEKHIGSRFHPKLFNMEVIRREIKKADYLIFAIGLKIAPSPKEPSLEPLYDPLQKLVQLDLSGKNTRSQNYTPHR